GARGAELDALVVVVDGHGQDPLGVVLADDVVVQELEDLTRLGQLVEAQLGGLGQLLLDDLVAQVDALVADVHAGPGDQLLDLLLGLAAEAALEKLAAIPELGQRPSPVPRIPGRLPAQLARIAPVLSANSRAEMTSSTRP